jgi:hypothetical protein
VRSVARISSSQASRHLGKQVGEVGTAHPNLIGAICYRVHNLG